MCVGVCVRVRCSRVEDFSDVNDDDAGFEGGGREWVGVGEVRTWYEWFK